MPCFNIKEVNKKLCDGIEIVAAIERTSKKQAAELLMKVGLSRYMGINIGEYIKNEQAARELNQKMKMTRFVMVLRRYAKEHGMDISKII
jgi:cell division protein FtsX